MRSPLLSTEQPLVASTTRPALRPLVVRQGSRYHSKPCLIFPKERLFDSRAQTVCRSVSIQAEEDVEFDVVISEFPAPSAGSFLPDKRSFREEHRIRGYEVSPDQRATIVTIANLLQVSSAYSFLARVMML